MGLAISRQVNGYEAVNQLELRHLALSDLETCADVQSGAAPALGGGATWSRKVQVDRIFGAAPHHPKLSGPQHHGRSHLVCALLVLGFLVFCKVYLPLTVTILRQFLLGGRIVEGRWYPNGVLHTREQCAKGDLLLPSC